MCACRLEAKSNQSTPVNGLSPQHHVSQGVDLEGFEELYSYLEMDRSEMAEESEDVFTQLAQKERDLILAAELGKALLEKNEELTKKNENLNEEFHQKLEELTQDKHELRLQLEAVETEYTNTVKELQNDVTLLRKELAEEQEHSRQGEKTKSQIIHELTQQNERLTEQLRKASHREEQLETQVSSMREQIQSRRTNLHDHVHQLEVLREEINMTTERKSDLERRIAIVSEERDSLSVSLEDAQDRILMIEKSKRDQDQQVRNNEREIQELRVQNIHLQEKLETLSLQASNSVFDQSSSSLFNELEMSQLSNSMSVESLENVELPNGSTPVQNGPSHMLSPRRHLGKTGSLEDQVKVLQLDLGAMRRHVEKLKGDLAMKDQELEKRMEELAKLTDQIAVQHEELAKMQEERDRLQDDACGLTRDDVIEQARKDRDDAITKKNNLEVDLAKTKLDLMKLDGQLMEAIQQKIELSQQLEQWELDMHELLDMQLTKRIQQEESNSAASSRSNTPPTRKRLTLPWS